MRTYTPGLESEDLPPYIILTFVLVSLSSPGGGVTGCCSHPPGEQLITPPRGPAGSTAGAGTEGDWGESRPPGTTGRGRLQAHNEISRIYQQHPQCKLTNRSLYSCFETFTPLTHTTAGSVKRVGGCEGGLEGGGCAMDGV